MKLIDIQHTTTWVENGIEVKNFKAKIETNPNWLVQFTVKNGVQSNICFWHKLLGGTFIYPK